MHSRLSDKFKRLIEIIKTSGFITAFFKTVDFASQKLFHNCHFVWIHPYLIAQRINYETPVTNISLITDYSDTKIITEYSDISPGSKPPKYGYEPGLVQAIASVVQSNSTFYDVGSRYGYYLKLVSNLGINKKDIHSFEENPRSYGYLRRNANNIAKLNYISVGSGKNNLSLDEYAEKHPNPDVVKIDVDGAEYTVLQGMTEILSRDIDLFLEFHPNHLSEKNAKEILETLRKSGFTLEVIEHRAEVNEIQYIEDPTFENNCLIHAFK